MNLTIILIIAVVLSIMFHFIGVYAKAKKLVWITIVLIWVGAISIATGEIKQKGYDDIKVIQGKYKDTDELIQKAMPKISIYEMIKIKQSFMRHEPKQ